MSWVSCAKSLCATSLCAWVALVLLASPVFAQSIAQRPNVILIMTDDQGYWDTGATGNPHIKTPHMDAIAKQGATLSRYYAAPVCAPTRAGIMTGRYYLRTGLYNTRFGGDTLGKDEVTVAELLRCAGYRTSLFGKWHLGKYPGYQPQQRGFDEFMGHYHGHIERYQFADQLYHNGQPVRSRGYVSDLFTDAAIDFIRQSDTASDQPFFCALMYNAPHSPFLLDTSHYDQPQGDAIIKRYLDAGLPIREARIYAMIERIDQNIGRLKQTLKELGQWQNTVLIFTSDNGGVSTYYNGGMHGRKASVYEGGVRAPCFVQWPGRIPAGTIINAQTSHIDWLPTFCELAGAKLPEDRQLDGRSLASLLCNDSDAPHHRYVYHTWDRYTPNPHQRWAISGDRWKLMCQVAATVTDSSQQRKQWRLYDLQADPDETKNLIGQHPEIANQLRKEFLAWFADVTEGQTYQPVAIPVGHPDEAVVELSPSWAKLKGDHVQYVFEGYDWDTIEGWRNAGESATWQLDVQAAGDYLVKASYGSAAVDSGGCLQLKFLSESKPQQIEHTVQATATANQFKTVVVGTVRLPKGKQSMTACVADQCDAELMRLNSLQLIRQ